MSLPPEYDFELDPTGFDSQRLSIESLLNVQVGEFITVPHEPKTTIPCNPANMMKVGAIGMHFVEGTQFATASATLSCTCGRRAQMNSIQEITITS